MNVRDLTEKLTGDIVPIISQFSTEKPPKRKIFGELKCALTEFITNPDSVRAFTSFLRDTLEGKHESLRLYGSVITVAAIEVAKQNSQLEDAQYFLRTFFYVGNNIEMNPSWKASSLEIYHIFNKERWFYSPSVIFEVCHWLRRAKETPELKEFIDKASESDPGSAQDKFLIKAIVLYERLLGGHGTPYLLEDMAEVTTSPIWEGNDPTIKPFKKLRGPLTLGLEAILAERAEDIPHWDKIHELHAGIHILRIARRANYDQSGDAILRALHESRVPTAVDKDAALIVRPSSNAGPPEKISPPGDNSGFQP